MSGDVSDRKRLIAITEANLKEKNKHIYISGHHDFFPDECYGQSSKEKGIGKEMTLIVEGLTGTFKTDIGIDGDNGKPRNFFRNRKWVRKFFEKHEIRAGDVVAIERLSKYTYRIYPFESKNLREGAHIPDRLHRRAPGFRIFRCRRRCAVALGPLPGEGGGPGGSGGAGHAASRSGPSSFRP